MTVAWLNLTLHNQTVKNGLKAKKIKLSQMNFFLEKQLINNFLKILRVDPELWGCAIFRPKMAQLSCTKNFWYKTLLLLSSTYWPFSLCKIFLKKSYSGTRVMRMRHFRALNGPFTPNNIFFWEIIKINFI